MAQAAVVSSVVAANIKRLRRLVLLLSALLLANSAFAQETAIKQQSMVKSVFLLNVAKFVEWPEWVYQKRPEQLLLCQLERDLLGEGFAIIGDRSVDGRRISKRTISTKGLLQACDLLYLEQRQYSDFAAQIEAETLSGLLVVLDGTQDSGAINAYPGVHVTLFRRNEKIAFAVNLIETQKSQLKLSSELLKLSTIIGGQ